MAALTQAAMNGGEKDEKDDSLRGTRGDFVELDTGSISRELPVVRIDGPYGAPAEDVFNVEIAVLVGAGIGMAHFHAHFVISRLDRCHSLRLNLETYMVSSAKWQSWQLAQGRVLLDLPRRSFVWLVPESVAGS